MSQTRMITYLEEQLQAAYSRDENAKLIMQFVLFCWLLQSKQFMVHISKLKEFFETDAWNTAYFFARTDLRKIGLIEYLDDERMILSGDAMQLVSKLFNESESGYVLNKKLFYQGEPRGEISEQISGAQFMELIRLVHNPVSNATSVQGAQLAQIIGTTLSKLLPELGVEVPDSVYSPNIILISGREMIWSFLLVLYPSRVPLGIEDINRCVGYVTPVREELLRKRTLPDLKTLIISSPISTNKDVLAHWKRFPFFYHIEDLEFIKLFNFLTTHASEVEKIQLYQNFMMIFNETTNSAFHQIDSSSIRNVHAAEIIIPIEQSTTADYSYRLVLSKSGGNYTLMRNDAQKYLTEPSVLVEHDGSYHIVRFIPLSSFEIVESLHTEPLYFDDYKKKLSSQESMILQRAIAKYVSNQQKRT